MNSVSTLEVPQHQSVTAADPFEGDEDHVILGAVGVCEVLGDCLLYPAPLDVSPVLPSLFLGSLALLPRYCLAGAFLLHRR